MLIRKLARLYSLWCLLVVYPDIRRYPWSYKSRQTRGRWIIKTFFDPSSCTLMIKKLKFSTPDFHLRWTSAKIFHLGSQMCFWSTRDTLLPKIFLLLRAYGTVRMMLVILEKISNFMVFFYWWPSDSWHHFLQKFDGVSRLDPLISIDQLKSF